MASRWTASGALLLLVLAPLAQAAPWLQHGYDAARTGATPDPGPATFDLAFQVQLPAEPAAPPLLLDDAAFVLVEGGPTVGGLYRVDLADAQIRRLAAFAEEGSQTSSTSSDGQRIFVVVANSVHAYSLEGALAWEREIPSRTVAEAFTSTCAPGAVLDGTLYLACTQFALSAPVTGVEPRGIVLALDTEDGAIRGLVDLTSEPPRQGAPGGPPPAPPQAGGGSVSPRSIAVAGERVLVVTRPQSGLVGQIMGTYTDRVWAVDRNASRVEWVFTPVYPSTSPDIPRNPEDRAAPTGGDAHVLVATAETVFVKGPTLHAVDAVTGRERWRIDPLARGGGFLPQGNAMALDGSSLYWTPLLAAERLDVASRSATWTVPLPQGQDWDNVDGLIVAGGKVYGRTYTGPLNAFDVDDGTLAHVITRGGLSTAPSYAVGHGVLAVLETNGVLTFVGRTAASLAARAEASSLYPPVGETVRVDLSDTSPGVFGPATEFRAEWGDGTTTEWQPGAVLVHEYGAAGDREVRVQARNAAGQTSTAVMTLHVGASPPTALERAFSAENQEKAFFLIGLVLTLVGALFGLLRLRARRSRLQRELRALDEGYARTAARPAECEAFLRDRRARAQALLAAGKLDEPQLVVLERGIEERTRRLRLTAIEGRLDFLPFGMVRELQGILADGRVESWERRHFLDALDRDAFLSPDQKQKVRALVESWYATDAVA